LRAFLISLVAFAGVFVAGEARAQEQSAYSEAHLALAREVVLSLGSEALLVDMMNQMAPTMADQIIAGGADRQTAERFVAIFLQEFAVEVPRIIELTSIAYAGAFNEQQLRDIKAFYETSTGQALVMNMGEMTAAMTQAGMLIGEQVAQRSVQRIIAERQRRPENP